jgi:hypothetical protein
MKSVRMATVAITGLSLIALSGCGSDDKLSGPTSKLTLTEYKIEPVASTAKAGKLKLEAKNLGSAKHEILVIKQDASTFEKQPDGSVDEDKIPAANLMGEIEDIEGGTTKSKVFDLSPGTYTLLCNSVDTTADGAKVSHAAKNMIATLTVS